MTVDRIEVKTDPVSPNIRKASVDDLERTWHIISTCSDWLAEQGMTHWADYYSQELVREKLEKAEIYVLEENCKAVATITLGSIPPGYYTENDEAVNHMLKFAEPSAGAVYFTALAVLPEAQGRGHAKQLVVFAEELVRERSIKYIRFDARGDYTKLVEFYNRLGYRIVGEMPDADSVYYLFEKDLGVVSSEA